MAQTYSQELTPLELYVRDSGNNGDAIAARLRTRGDRPWNPSADTIMRLQTPRTR